MSVAQNGTRPDVGLDLPLIATGITAIVDGQNVITGITPKKGWPDNPDIFQFRGEVLVAGTAWREVSYGKKTEKFHLSCASPQGSLK